MLTTNHVLIGAVAGKVIGDPLIAFPTGIFLHYIFDKVPHFWPETDKNKRVVMILDTILCSTLLAFFFFTTGGLSSSIFWGAFGGFLVDAVFVGLKPFHDSKAGMWHTLRQIHKIKPIYFLTDASLLIIGLIIYIAI